MSSEIEEFVYETRDYIRAQYNSYLATINSEEGDGMTVENVKVGNIDILDLDPFSHNEYPVIDLYPTDSEVSHMSMGSDEMAITFTALIAINKGGASESTRKVFRYIEALRQVLRDASRENSLTWDVDPETPVTFSVYPSSETEIKLATVTWQGIKDIGV